MKIRVTVTLDIDLEAYCLTYGIGSSQRAQIREDVLEHVSNTLHETYVSHLGVARSVEVKA
jgi:hypothetical protein